MIELTPLAITIMSVLIIFLAGALTLATMAKHDQESLDEYRDRDWRYDG